MDMQAVATRVIGNALPSLDAGLSKLVTDDLRGGEHAIALIELLEGAPAAVPADVVDDLELFFADFDTSAAQIARKAISNYRRLQTA